MSLSDESVPDHTAVRVALWRAMHVELDSTPYVLADELGLKLVAPEANWRDRPDMHPAGTRGYRASIVARARFIEDLVEAELEKGVDQYVILGAGLDTFAQRRPDLSPLLRIFEIDQPETQAWKKRRLDETGIGAPKHLRFVPVDFESGESWREKLVANGFDSKRPAVVASTGVTMYLTREANLATFRDIAKLAAGSVFATTFMLPAELVKADERPTYEMVMERARAAGTPFSSLFRPEEIVDLARTAGFRSIEHVSGAELARRYFSGRSDGLIPATGEEFLIVRT